MLILRLITLQHLFVGCVTCYLHSMLFLHIHSYLLTVDSIGELTGNIIRVIMIPYIGKIKNRIHLQRLYQISSILFALSNVLFVAAALSNMSSLVIAGWMFNRWSSHIISAFRDAFLYTALARNPNTNVPLIKSFKSMGIFFTIIQVIYISSPTINNSIVILFSFITMVIGYVISRKINADDFGIPKTKNDGTFIPSNALKIIMLSMILFILPSDQMIYTLASRKAGIIYKFFGQTVIGMIYALIFKNHIFGPVTNQLLAIIIYIASSIPGQIAGGLACISLGLTTTITQSAYTILPHYIATNRHSMYQSIAIVAIDGMKLLCSMILDLTCKSLSSTQKVKIYMVYINAGLFISVSSYIVYGIIKKRRTTHNDDIAK